MAGKRPSLPAAKAVLFERVACRKPSYNTAKPFQPVSSELTVQDSLLMRSNQIVIPNELKREILDKIQEGHQDIDKSCK
jgi:hypothetical protein